MDREKGSSPSKHEGSSRRREPPDMSVMHRMKKGFLSFTTSLQEGLRYFKAILIGQVRNMSAKNEKEASEADMQTAKMQVEAADAAEDTKKRLGM